MKVALGLPVHAPLGTKVFPVLYDFLLLVFCRIVINEGAAIRAFVVALDIEPVLGKFHDQASCEPYSVFAASGEM